MKNDNLRRYPFFGAVTAVALAFLYLPLLIVAVYSFNADRSITVWSGFSLDWYVNALTNPQLQIAAMNSLIVAVSAATVATLFAFMAALVLVRMRSRKSTGIAYALINLPLAVPEIVTAIGTLLFFVLIGLPLGLTSIMLAHVVFCIPFAYLPLAARLQGIEITLEEAAADLYATRWETLRHVLIPLMMPGLISGFMLAFIVSIDDFIITSFVAGPGATTLPLAIYGMVRVGFTPEINAITTMMLALSSLTVLASFVFARRGGTTQALGH
jgi:spermidine/putrescine transport system permease protein